MAKSAAPTDRQKKFLADLVGKLAERDGKTTDDVYTELGLMEETPWGRKVRHNLTRVTFSIAIDMAKRDLASTPAS